MDIQHQNLHTDPGMPAACANCSFPLDQDFRYCPQCSQKVNLHRFSLHDILHDALHYFTHADKGVIGLVKDLFFKNGTVANEYVNGRRKKYFPPLNFFLLVGTIYVLMVNATNPHKEFNVLQEHPEISKLPTKEVQQYVIKLYERQHKAEIYMNKYSNVVAMIAIPMTCFFYWLCYIRSRYNYTEHMIAGLYMTGFYSLVFALIFAPVAWLIGIKPSSSLVFVIAVVLFQITYSAVFYYRFINKRTTAFAWKAAGVSLLVTVLWVGISGFLVVMYLLNGFWGLLD